MLFSSCFGVSKSLKLGKNSVCGKYYASRCSFSGDLSIIFHNGRGSNLDIVNQDFLRGLVFASSGHEADFVVSWQKLVIEVEPKKMKNTCVRRLKQKQLLITPLHTRRFGDRSVNFRI